MKFFIGCIVTLMVVTYGLGSPACDRLDIDNFNQENVHSPNNFF